jgi:hypothetical protein
VSTLLAVFTVQQPAGHTLLLLCPLEQHPMGFSAPCLHIATCYTDCHLLSARTPHTPCAGPEVQHCSAS